MKRILIIVISLIQAVLSVSAQSAKSDSLFALGVDLYNAGKYQEAIPIFKECDAIDVEDGIESSRRHYSVMWLAACYYQLGDSIWAKSINDYYKSPVDRRLMTEPELIIEEGIILYKRGDYNVAIKKLRQGIDVLKKNFEKSHLLYTKSYVSALFISVIDLLAKYHNERGYYSLAIDYASEALQLKGRIFGKENTDYATSLHVISSYYSKTEQFKKAIQLETEALHIREKYLGKDHPDYAVSLHNIALYNFKIGETSEAVRLCKESLQITNKTKGVWNRDYAVSKHTLALIYSEMGCYSEAIQIENEALHILSEIGETNTSDYALALGTLAGYYSYIDNFSEACRLGTKALQIQEEIHGKKHPEYAGTLNNLAMSKFQEGDYPVAISMGKETLRVLEETIGECNISYLTALNNLALYTYQMGLFEEHVQYQNKANQIVEKIFKERSGDYTIYLAYATMLNNNAVRHAELGYYAEALLQGKRALQIREEFLGKENPICLASLGNLSGYYSYLNNYSEAHRIGTKALRIIENTQGKDNRLYATVLNTLSSNSFNNADYEGAIRFGSESLRIREKVVGKGHPDCIASYVNMAWLNYVIGDVSALEKNAQSSYDAGKYFASNIFKSLTELERNHFWKMYQAVFQLPYMYSYKYPTKDLIECSYNSSLLNKGLLLNLSRSMSELIQSGGDQKALSLYESMRLNRMALQKQYEKPIAERTLDTDSLEALTADMERELVMRSKVFGDYTKDMSIQWEDVQLKLGDRDIAIEFLDFPLYSADTDADSSMYVALTLKQGYDSPHLIPLFERHQLNAIPEGSFYISLDLYNLVWKPLEEELAGAKNVFFSPSGELHRIAIENIPITANENIYDRYNLRRLSSTRQLVCHQDETAGEKSVVYGGLKYDAIVSDTIVTISSGQDRDFTFAPHANVDSLKLRSSYEYLPGTKEEADSIVANLSTHSLPYAYYYGAAGTEDSFKNLDGTKPKLLHIATHGFYMSEEDAARKNFPLLSFMNNEKAHREDKAMTRSGLLLSGCSRALKHETIPEGVEDGILTAEEISKLDMRGLDLVVLSACKTGLGDIISGEGVFGLQRGFKKAGAKTILMSLWKVDDDATQLLMTEFYKNYCSGIGKRESLRLAQKFVREYKDDDGNLKYDSPNYWAGFVMLD